MIRKVISYTDYDGKSATMVAYFHLNKFEWLELETYTSGGLVRNLENALETNNTKKTIDILKKLLLRAYGEKDPETGEFLKDDDRAIKFSKTEAFSELFYELAYNEEAAKEFFMGLIPAEYRVEAEKKVIEKQNEVVNQPNLTVL
ncbi:MAG: hypothetical protein GX638_11825 [Crenarchaeota archaeon]|nr:hypothetical protein [Thermoproteota archaeon]